jgi:DNA (cytosine-5)-methyltransferase 1
MNTIINAIVPTGNAAFGETGNSQHEFGSPEFRVAELFCGAGGMGLGLKAAGMEIAKAYDISEPAIANYLNNVGPHAEVADLSNVTSVIRKLMELELQMVAGGPPCQDFSNAGTGIEKENAELTPSFAAICAAVRPPWVFMENVAKARNSRAWKLARQILKNAGYGLTELVLNFAQYGVPQDRKRFIVIARLGERDGFLTSAVMEAAAPQKMSMRDYFGRNIHANVYFPARLPDRRSECSADEPAPTIRSASDRPNPARLALPATHGTSGRKIKRYEWIDAETPLLAANFAMIQNGHFYCRPYSGGRGVRTIDEPMSTVVRTSWERPTKRYLNAPHRSDPVSADVAARLTTDQLSEVQGFPSIWEWLPGPRRERMQMIANAVPAPAARVLGKIILSRHRGETIPAMEEGFGDWLDEKGHSPQMRRNLKSNLNRARRMLGGRTFADPVQELGSLEEAPEFSALSPGAKSSLRQALRAYHAFQTDQEREGANGRGRRRRATSKRATSARSRSARKRQTRDPHSSSHIRRRSTSSVSARKKERKK